MEYVYCLVMIIFIIVIEKSNLLIHFKKYSTLTYISCSMRPPTPKVSLLPEYTLEYFTLGVLLLVCCLASFYLILLSKYLTSYLLSSGPSGSMNKAYECGFSPSGDARGSIQIHFYIVALMFAIFDIEIALLLPWAFGCDSFTGFSTLVILYIFFFLGCGIAYEIVSSSLSWFFKIKNHGVEERQKHVF